MKRPTSLILMTQRFVCVVCPAIPQKQRQLLSDKKCQGTDVASLVRWGSLWLSVPFNGCFIYFCVRGDLLLIVIFAAKFAASFFRCVLVLAMVCTASRCSRVDGLS